MKHLFSIIIGLLLAAHAATSLGQSANWNLASLIADKSFTAENYRIFAEDVKNATNGRIEIKVHTASTLIKEQEIRDAVRKGVVPLGDIIMSTLGNENPVFEADSLPFLATSYQQALVLWNVTRPYVERHLDRQGMMVLFVTPLTPQGFFTKKPVATVADFKGMKFRTYNSLTARMAELLGAVPTQVVIADVPSAFSTGRIDGMVTSPVTGANISAWDFSSYFYHTQGWLPNMGVLMNKAIFGQLDKKDQKIILDAAATAQKRGWEMSDADTMRGGVDILKAKGMKGITPPAELVNGLRKIGATMAAEWEKKGGADAEAIMKAYRAK